MIAALAKSIFGSSNDRYVRSLGKYVDAVNGFEPTISAMTDDELRGQTSCRAAGRCMRYHTVPPRIISPEMVSPSMYTSVESAT